MNSTAPLVTVLMPAFNAERYVAKAIASILDQTFEDFEFVIVDDGSTDRTAEIIQSFADRRIRYVCNPRNLRIAATLNRGLEISRGALIARMDSDDIAVRTRLERQVRYLQDHSSVTLVGTSMRLVDDEGRALGTALAVTEPNLLRWRQHFSNQINHPTVMFRYATLKELGLRYGEVPTWAQRNGAIETVDHLSEDYLLFGLMAQRTSIANLPDILHLYRVHGGSVSGSQSEAQQKMACGVAGLLFSLILDRPVPSDAVRLAYFTRSQHADAPAIEGACAMIENALQVHLRRYAIPNAQAETLRRDATARQRVLRNSGTSILQRLVRLTSGPIWPRDREEARLLVRSLVSEDEINCYKRWRRALVAAPRTAIKH